MLDRSYFHYNAQVVFITANIAFIFSAYDLPTTFLVMEAWARV